MQKIEYLELMLNELGNEADGQETRGVVKFQEDVAVTHERPKTSRSSDKTNLLSDDIDKSISDLYAKTNNQVISK